MSIDALKFSKAAQNYFSSIQVMIFVRVLQIYLVAGVVVKSGLPFMLAKLADEKMYLKGGGLPCCMLKIIICLVLQVCSTLFTT